MRKKTETNRWSILHCKSWTRWKRYRLTACDHCVADFRDISKYIAWITSWIWVVVLARDDFVDSVIWRSKSDRCRREKKEKTRIYWHRSKLSKEGEGEEVGRDQWYSKKNVETICIRLDEDRTEGNLREGRQEEDKDGAWSQSPFILRHTGIKPGPNLKLRQITRLINSRKMVVSDSVASDASAYGTEIGNCVR